MELNNTTRNRRVGFVGVAVATLLTPAGKLISSAVAAGVTMAVITMSDGPTPVETEKSPLPKLATSSALIEEYFADVIATSELTNSEPSAAVLATRENSAGMMLTSMPPTVVLSNTPNAPSGGSLFEIPALGPAVGPDPISIYKDPRDPDPRDPYPHPSDCEQVLKKDASERTELEKTLCEVLITQTEKTKEEIVQLIAEVTPESNPAGGNEPPLIVSNDTPPQNIENTPKPPADTDPPENKSDNPPTVLSSEPVFRLTNNGPVTIAAIPEPSTIGLLLLGLFGLGWVTRRNTRA